MTPTEQGWTDYTGSTGATGTHTTHFTTIRGRQARSRMARSADLWRRITRGTKRTAARVRAIVTPTGWLMGAFTVIGIPLGAIFGWNEILVIGLASGILLLLAVPFLFGMKKYRVNLQLERDRITVGDALEGVIDVTNDSARPLLPGHIELPVGTGRLEVGVPFLGGSAQWKYPLDLPTSRRSIISVGPPQVRRGDPLGVLRREHAWGSPQTVFIRPRFVVLPATATGFLRDLEGHPMPQLVSDDLAFHAIREYAAGDSPRQIHWKSTAKAGKLMVRQYEVTRRSQLMVVLANREDEYSSPEEFELAVSAAASMGVRGFQDGRDLQFLLGGELPPMAPLGMRRVAELPTVNRGTMLDALAGINMYQQANSLGEIVETASERSRGTSLAVLVVGSQLTPAQIRAAVLALPAGVGVLVVQCDQYAEPGYRRLGETGVVTVAVLEDLRHVLSRRAAL